MKERAFLFGETRSLLGIMTEPAGAAADPSCPAVLLLNAGLVHRIGPNRMYVNAARRLAAAGFTVLRFDFSGIGDSKPREDQLALDQRAVVETQEAMSFLTETRGIESFVLMGLCSGADDAVRVALVDQRVVGLGLIEPCAYFAKGWYRYSYGKRLANPRSWVDLVTGKSDLWGLLARKIKARFVTQPQKSHAEDWDVLSLEDFRGALAALSERDVKLLLSYCESSPAYYNYRVHVTAKLDTPLPDTAVRVQITDASDHTFTRISDQTALLEGIEDWARSLRPAAALT